MNKMQAVIEIIREAQKDKNALTGYKRALRALKVLEFNTEDATTILIHLDYVSFDTREPYPWLAKQLEARK